jgi:multidrug efflux pump subunit AcrA (membrane-fusion protein)
VSPETVLTTIDTGGGLELYIHVPVDDAPGLVSGLPVRLVDDAGTVLAETALDFVSPQVDEGTQTVLAKAPLAGATGFRPEQQVRARIVWSADPGLRVPVVAVSRIGGRYFSFVVEQSENGTVARQRGVRVGPIVGNDYVVLDGLAPGDQLIVSGIQKVRDGAPVDPKPHTPAERG